MRYLTSIFVAALFAFVLYSAVMAGTARPADPGCCQGCDCGCADGGGCGCCNVQKKDAPPQFPIETRWGKLAQLGTGISIEGWCWQAQGRIRDDGKLYLLWVCKSDGRQGHSVYTIDGKVTGHWGWCDETRIDDAGELLGTLKDDHLYYAETPAPPEL